MDDFQYLRTTDRLHLFALFGLAKADFYYLCQIYNRENDLCNFSKPNVQKPRFFAHLSGFVFG